MPPRGMSLLALLPEPGQPLAMARPDPRQLRSTDLGREGLREPVRNWTACQRRIFVERAIERLPRDLLVELLEGLVRPDHLHGIGTSPTPPLLDRVTRHVEATRRGDFLGDYALRNRHGEREPQETHAWVAATSHLFDLALTRCADPHDDEARTCLDLLSALSHEVDERPEELVCFEDSDAALELSHELDRARRLLRPFEPRNP